MFKARPRAGLGISGFWVAISPLGESPHRHGVGQPATRRREAARLQTRWQGYSCTNAHSLVRTNLPIHAARWARQITGHVGMALAKMEIRVSPGPVARAIL